MVSFVEVRSRFSSSRVLPQETINKKKQRRISKAAQIYLVQKHIDIPGRFDVASVIAGCDRSFEVFYIEDAFDSCE